MGVGEKVGLAVAVWVGLCVLALALVVIHYLVIERRRGRRLSRVRGQTMPYLALTAAYTLIALAALGSDPDSVFLGVVAGASLVCAVFCLAQLVKERS